MTAQWPGYDDYQAGTKRDIPVVLPRPVERGTRSQTVESPRADLDVSAAPGGSWPRPRHRAIT